MSTTFDSDLRFAILIDADNISEKYIKVVLQEVANAGTATYKRIYGDWTSPRLASWKSCLLDNSIDPDAAVQLHVRQERDRFGDHHRCHGYSVFGHRRRIRDREFRFRFHEACRTLARKRYDRHWNGRAEDPSALYIRMQSVQVPRPAVRGPEGRGRRCAG